MTQKNKKPKVDVHGLETRVQRLEGALSFILQCLEVQGGNLNGVIRTLVDQEIIKPQAPEGVVVDKGEDVIERQEDEPKEVDL